MASIQRELERHLTTPLLAEDGLAACYMQQTNTESDILIWRSAYLRKIMGETVAAQLLSPHQFFGHLLCETRQMDHLKEVWTNKYQEDWARATEFCNLIQETLSFENSEIMNFSGLEKRTQVMEVLAEIFNIFSRTCHQLTRKSTKGEIKLPDPFKIRQGIKGNVYVLKEADVTIGYFETVVCIVLNTQKNGAIYTCADFNFFLMVQDVLNSRYLAYGAADLFKGSDISPTSEQLEMFFEEGDKLLVKHGNNMYMAVKEFESRMTAHLMTKPEESQWSSLPGQDYIDAVNQSFAELDTKIPGAKTFMEDISKYANNRQQIHQLKGLFRLWGHPYVSTREGAKKARRVGNKEKRPNAWILKMLERKTKEIVFTKFTAVGKNSMYPPFSLDPAGEKTYLGKCLINQDSINLLTPQYEISHWDYVTLDKTFDIGGSYNIISCLKDKSHCQPRSIVEQNILKGLPVNFGPPSKVICSFLKDKTVDRLTVIKEVLAMPYDIKVVAITPKEREVDLIPRMFAMLHYMLRLYFVITEEILSENFLPMFKSICMTDNLPDQIKRKSQIGHKDRSSSDRIKSFFFSLDYSKWNLEFRKEITAPVFSILDSMCGVKDLFSITHKIFEESLIVVSNGRVHLNKDFSEYSDGLWIGHKGGFEGLRQKGWTIVTSALIALMEDAMEHTTMAVIGSGDNQSGRMDIKVPDNVPVGEEEQWIMSRLKNNFKIMDLYSALLTLPLKMAETWKDEHLFCFTKDTYYKVNLSQCIKKWTRMFYQTNDEIPTLDNAIGTVFAASRSGAETSPTYRVGYMLALYQSQKTLRSYLEYNPVMDKPMREATLVDSYLIKSDGREEVIPRITRQAWQSKHFFADLVYSMWMCPKVLGGYSIQTPYDYMLRQFPDHMSQACTWLCNIARRAPYKDKYLGQRLSTIALTILNLWRSDVVNNLALATDPNFVNVVQPTTGRGLLKQIVREMLEVLKEQNNLNPQIGNYLEYVTEGTEAERIATLLTSAEPFFPRFVRDLFAITPVGIAESILGRIEKTTVVMKIVKNHEDAIKRIYHRLNKAETSMLQALVWRTTGRRPLAEVPDCPSKFARDMRKFLNQKRVIKGADIPHPAAHLDTVAVYGGRCNGKREDECTNLWVVTIDEQARCGNLLEKQGRFLPYIGSSTESRVHAPISSTRVHLESLVRKEVMVASSLGWFVPKQSPLGTFIIDTLKLTIGGKYLLLIPEGHFCPGTPEHRYTGLDGMKGGFSCILLGNLRFVSVSSERLIEFTRGKRNTNLLYQSDIVYASYLAAEDIWLKDLYKQSVPDCYHLHHYCPHCVVELVDMAIDQGLQHGQLKADIPRWMTGTFAEASLEIPVFSPRMPKQLLLPLKMNPEQQAIHISAFFYKHFRKLAILKRGEGKSAVETETSKALYKLKLNPHYFLENVCNILFLELMLTREWLRYSPKVVSLMQKEIDAIPADTFLKIAEVISIPQNVRSIFRAHLGLDFSPEEVMRPSSLKGTVKSLFYSMASGLPHSLYEWVKNSYPSWGYLPGWFSISWMFIKAKAQSTEDMIWLMGALTSKRREWYRLTQGSESVEFIDHFEESLPFEDMSHEEFRAQVYLAGDAFACIKEFPAYNPTKEAPAQVDHSPLIWTIVDVIPTAKIPLNDVPTYSSKHNKLRIHLTRAGYRADIVIGEVIKNVTFPVFLGDGAGELSSFVANVTGSSYMSQTLITTENQPCHTSEKFVPVGATLSNGESYVMRPTTSGTMPSDITKKDIIRYYHVCVEEAYSQGFNSITFIDDSDIFLTEKADMLEHFIEFSKEAEIRDIVLITRTRNDYTTSHQGFLRLLRGSFKNVQHVTMDTLHGEEGEVLSVCRGPEELHLGTGEIVNSRPQRNSERQIMVRESNLTEVFRVTPYLARAQQLLTKYDVTPNTKFATILTRIVWKLDRQTRVVNDPLRIKSPKTKYFKEMCLFWRAKHDMIRDPIYVIRNRYGFEITDMLPENPVYCNYLTSGDINLIQELYPLVSQE